MVAKEFEAMTRSESFFFFAKNFFFFLSVGSPLAESKVGLYSHVTMKTKDQEAKTFGVLVHVPHVKIK